MLTDLMHRVRLAVTAAAADLAYHARLTFLRFCIWQAKYDREIGRSTGRDPQAIRGLTDIIISLEGDLAKMEIQK